MGELEQKLLPNCTHVGHPGYMGLITPSPSPIGIIADFICSALNQNIGAYTLGPAAVAMERRTVRWLTDLVGYGEDAGWQPDERRDDGEFHRASSWRGTLFQGDRIEQQGCPGTNGLFTHRKNGTSRWIKRWTRWGWDVWRCVRCPPKPGIPHTAGCPLEAAIEEDQQSRHTAHVHRGHFREPPTPGRIDPVRALRGVADREGMWLHIDAAYGGGMLLSHAWPMRDQGLELADSITIDPHKWFYAPLDVGAILVKDDRRLTASFGLKPAYLYRRSSIARTSATRVPFVPQLRAVETLSRAQGMDEFQALRRTARSGNR